MASTAGLPTRLIILWSLHIVVAVRACNPVNHKSSESTSSESSTRTSMDRNQTLLWEAIQHAERESTDGRVELPKMQSPSTSGSTKEIVRALTGTTVTINCSNHHSDPMSTKQKYESLLWRYEPISQGSAAVNQSDAVPYSVRNVNGTSYLSINVTAFSGGNFECLRYCGNGILCVVRKFLLKPKLRPSDVFVGRMQNVTILFTYGAEFTCAVKFRCCPDPSKHFIWKSNGAFAFLPEGHVIRSLTALQQPYLPYRRLNESYTCAHPHFCQQSMTVAVNFLRGHPDRGEVECWVRPDLTTEEWIVQKASYHFTWN